MWKDASSMHETPAAAVVYPHYCYPFVCVSQILAIHGELEGGKDAVRPGWKQQESLKKNGLMIVSNIFLLDYKHCHELFEELSITSII